MKIRILSEWRLFLIFVTMACFRSALAQQVNFAAVGYNATNSLYSTNGINWTSGPGLPSVDGWGSTIYGASKFVAISGSGDTNMIYSTNGINWTEGFLPFSDSWDKVAYGNGLFFATTWGSKSEAYSTNGINWTGSTNLMPVSGDWYCLAYGNGVYVAIAPNSSNAACSLNGTNWTLTSMPYNAYWQGVTFGNGKFVAVVGGTSQSAYSTNGSNWVAGSGLPSDNWSSVTYGNGLFVANAYTSSHAAYSSNGINWTSTSMPTNDNWYSSDFASGAGVFATLAQSDGHAAYSTNGITWSLSPNLPVSDVWYGIAARNDPPVITNQPITQSVAIGDSATFGVGSSGSLPITYQWFFDGTNIAGATNSSLALFNIALNQAGSYSVTVSNQWGSVSSSSATLNVSTPNYSVLNTNQIPGDSTTLSNFTFQGDTTYYINGPILLYGNTTVEGGSVIKFGTNSYCQLDIMGSNFTCATASYRPTVFTSMDDNSAGSVIDGSTGNPWNDNAGALALYFSTKAANLNYLRFSHLAACVSFQSSGSDTGGNLTMSNFQAVDCVQLVMSRAATCYICNGLIYEVSNIFGAYGIGGTSGQTLAAVNVTAHECENYALDLYSSMYFTNCLFLDVTNTYSGSGVVSTNFTYILTNHPSVFQTAGAAAHYLADTTYRGVGTTNIGGTLLADLQMKTTYPPVTNLYGFLTNDYIFFPQAQRDNSGLVVDIGYHYDPIDYAIAVGVSNATAKVLPGTVIAGMGPSYGVWLYSASTFNCSGTATSPSYLVRYNTVQEQSNTNWESTSWVGFFYGPSSDGTATPANFVFTDWSSLAGDGQFAANGETSPMCFQDCHIYNGSVNVTNTTLLTTNCLFQRVSMNLSGHLGGGSSATSNSFCNNLFIDGNLTFNHNTNHDTGFWTFRDNLFDRTSFTNNNISANDIISNNAYVTTNFGTLLPHGGDVTLTNSPNYQTSFLGEFYYPTNQTNLIHTGSQLASAAGLYHYTVTTNNTIEGTNQVSIGFHYVATDTNGIPLDSNGDGIPDYLEDINGNGLVDSGETAWNVAGDLGLSVWITQPANNSKIP